MYPRPPQGASPSGTTLGAAEAPLVDERGAVLAAGERVDGFEVKRLLGQGGMGCVYLARDVRLGRLVALKLILPSRITPERTQRFLEEARITARFSHPHIVIVHALGQVRGQPYIALEYLDGSNLRSRLDAGRPSVVQACRWGLAIGRALSAAHAHGVLHCDLKPDNVVLPCDGRLRVVDFGLAQALDPGGGASRLGGTPKYMAPEQWAGRRLTPATDVWALGLMLAEMFAGRHPLDGQATDPEDVPTLLADLSRVDLGACPEPVAHLVRRCLSVDPAGRPHLEEVEATLAGPVEHTAPSSRVNDCPFPGLLPYDAQHSTVFFGREGEVDAFIERMRTETVLPVVGPSGAGKSSFVRAGVVPRLQEEGAWALLVMRPGVRPLRTLAARVVALESGRSRDSVVDDATDPVDALEARLRAKPGSLAVELERVARVCRSRVLVFVDQAEEACTQADPATRDAFLTALCQGADDPESPVRVIFTARDDFLGKLAATPAMQSALSRVTVLRRLDEAALRQIVEGPLARTHHAWDDPAVVDDMVRELLDEPAGLPLLQFACRSLWDQRDKGRRLLLRARYEAMGGLGGALAQHADGVLDAMTEQERNASRSLLLRLSTPQGNRRVVSRADALRDLGEAGEVAAERLLAARLLVGRRAGGEAALEVAHEALLRAWPRVLRWVEESREERVLLEELSQAAALWTARGGRDDQALAGDALADALRRIARLGVAVPDDVQALLAAGARSEQRARRKRRLILGGALASLTAIAIVSTVVAAAFAERERQALEQSRAIALATGDVGVFDLELLPFDWDPATLRATEVSAEALPELSVSLHAPDPTDRTLPGDPVPEASIARERLPVAGWHERIEARSGAAWIRIDGRGRAGDSCGPSWVFVQALPGFADRATPQKMALHVPTCAATLAGTLPVPGGPVILAGPGDPPIRRRENVRPEEVRDLPSFRLDATEVTNAQLALYLEMAPLTGARRSIGARVAQLQAAQDPDRPATQLTAYDAEALCRFLGKRLPTSDEWAKAVRGGIHLAGTLNPMPRRPTPWGTLETTRRANLLGDGDGFDGVAPAGSFLAGQGPYGHLDLAGNVGEWTATPVDGADRHGMRVIRGDSWADDPQLEGYVEPFRNSRDPRYLSFDLGVRCAVDGP